MTHRELIDLIPEAPPRCTSCVRENYQAWSEKPIDLDGSFQCLGKLDDEIHTDRSRSTPFPGKVYWDPDYPINLNYYPQTECEIVQCGDCASILITYTETSGDFPQERIRWVQKHLLSDSTS